MTTLKLTFDQRLAAALENGKKIGKRKRVSSTSAHNYCVAYLYTLPHCTYKQLVLLTREWYKGFDLEHSKLITLPKPYPKTTIFHHPV